MKQFPIMWPIGCAYGTREEAKCPTSIPWDVIAPHGRQAYDNHEQTLEELARRGGLDPSEAVAVLTDRRWRELGVAAHSCTKAQLQDFVKELNRIVQEHEES
jgi:hypothetical protein